MATGTVRTLPELPASSRYELLFKLASGGMASVYVGRIRGAGGFWRLVAIKRAHPHLLEDPSFRRMLVEEARLASRIHHPNVVAVQDVEQVEDHLLLVMDYVEGASLADILAVKGRPLPPRLAVRIALDACAGLRAAHELTDAAGKPLHIVHRDVSPQNLLVGVDGVSRLADFGIARSTQHASTTTTGALKGKLAYMAPEYVDGKPPDQRCDVFGLGVVIWEALANRRLFRGETEVDTLKRIVNAEAPLLSSVAPHIGPDLDPVLAAALAKDPDERFTSAKALGNALEIAARRADLIAPAEDVGAFVQSLFASPLSERRRLIQERVSADVGPTSGRPTVPMPQRKGSPDDTSSAASLATSGPEAAPLLTSPAEPATTTTGNRISTAVTSTSGETDPGHSSSTLDGSGISRSSAGPPSSALPVKPRRTTLILAATGALILGGIAAVAVTRLTSPSPRPDGPASPAAPALNTLLSATAAVSPGPWNTPFPADSAPSSAPTTAPSTTAAPTAKPSVSPAGSAKKPVRATPTSTAAADVLPNPYGVK